MFDFNNYPKDSKIFDENIKKVIGKMKDKSEGKIIDKFVLLILKRLDGRGEEGVKLTPPHVVFSKNVSSKERVKPRFFVTFNIIIRHIFPENFIEINQVVQKL